SSPSVLWSCLSAVSLPWASVSCSPAFGSGRWRGSRLPACSLDASGSTPTRPGGRRTASGRTADAPAPRLQRPVQLCQDAGGAGIARGAGGHLVHHVGPAHAGVEVGEAERPAPAAVAEGTRVRAEREDRKRV